MALNFRRIQVLSQFSPYLQFFATYHSKDERENDANAHGNKTVYRIVVTVMIIMHLIQVFCGYWYCEEHHFALSKITATVPVTLHSIQYLLVYVSFSTKYQKICDTIDRLQRIVENRKCCCER